MTAGLSRPPLFVAFIAKNFENCRLCRTDGELGGKSTRSEILGVPAFQNRRDFRPTPIGGGGSHHLFKVYKTGLFSSFFLKCHIFPIFEFFFAKKSAFVSSGSKTTGNRFPPSKYPLKTVRPFSRAIFADFRISSHETPPP